MRTLQELKQEGYTLCLAQNIRLDSGLIGKFLCALMCREEKIVIHVIRASLALSYGQIVVDENGDIITILDPDLEKKLVVTRNDLNLWYALLQSGINDQMIEIEILNSISNKHLQF